MNIMGWGFENALKMDDYVKKGPSSYGFTSPLASRVVRAAFTSASEVALLSVIFRLP